MGIALSDAIDNERFRFFVRDGDEVGVALELDALLAAHVVFQNIAAGPSKFNREIEVFHYRSGVLEALN